MIVVLPGDDLTSHVKPQVDVLNTNNQSKNPSSFKNHGDGSAKPIKLGTGLIFNPKSNAIVATMAGRLHHNQASNTYFVVANTKRYIPQLNDRVIAIIEDRMGDYYRVTIPHTSQGSAILHITAFTGATKRNRPNLKHGDLIYGRICTSDNQHKLMEPEITCTVLPGEQSGGAASKDWMTDEGTYGQLKGGTCISVSIGLARELLNPYNVVLDELGSSELPFEICIGVNGMVWVNAQQPEYTILVLNAIQNSEVMTEEQVRGMVRSLVQTIKSTKTNSIIQADNDDYNYDGNGDINNGLNVDEEDDHLAS
jgi:exosome complex component RRP40